MTLADEMREMTKEAQIQAAADERAKEETERRKAKRSGEKRARWLLDEHIPKLIQEAAAGGRSEVTVLHGECRGYWTSEDEFARIVIEKWAREQGFSTAVSSAAFSDDCTKVPVLVIRWELPSRPGGSR